MKLQNTPILNQRQNLKTNSEQQQVKNTKTAAKGVSFGAGEILTASLNFLETQPAWGATFVDLASMVATRTIIDFTRGPEAGMETARRESVSLVNDAALGLYGWGAAAIIASQFNKEFGVKAQSMFISDEALDVLGKTWDDNKKAPDVLNKYLTQIFQNTKAFNPELKGADKNGWVGIDKNTQSVVVKELKKSIENSDKLDKKLLARLEAIIANSTGSDTTFKLAHKSLDKSAEVSLNGLLENVFKTAKAFKTAGVSKAFESGLSNNAFLSKLKNISKLTGPIGLGASMIVGLSIQPLNVYLTKKKTGKTGFVGTESKHSDNSKGFQVAKYAVSAAAAFAALRSIGKFPQIIDKIKFTSMLPTYNQFKLVYGMTIVSRLLSARDPNELRETAVKDSLGFINWLILGGIVSKGVAAAFDKANFFKDGSKFIRYNKAENGTKPLEWLNNSKISSYTEILQTGFKKAGKNFLHADGSPMGLKELMKQAKELKIPDVRGKVALRAVIQLSGILYSCLVLGIGIPKLNIAMTKSAEKKAKEKAKAEQGIEA